LNQKDIQTLIQTLISSQSVLLKDKDIFSSLRQEIEEKSRINPSDKPLKSLKNMLITWDKILNLWQELEEKLSGRQETITTIISKAETDRYIHLKPFSGHLEAFIRGTAYLSLDALNLNQFEELISGFSLKDRIPKSYFSRLRECLGLVKDVQDFLSDIKKASFTSQYYHLSYDLYLGGDKELEEIRWLENELKPQKPTDYQIPEQRLVQVIRRLMTDLSGKKPEQIKIIDRIKSYTPMTSIPAPDELSQPHEGPRFVDF